MLIIKFRHSDVAGTCREAKYTDIIANCLFCYVKKHSFDNNANLIYRTVQKKPARLIDAGISRLRLFLFCCGLAGGYRN